MTDQERPMDDGVREMRLVVTAPDYEASLPGGRFDRDRVRKFLVAGFQAPDSPMRDPWIRRVEQ